VACTGTTLPLSLCIPVVHKPEGCYRQAQKVAYKLESQGIKIENSVKGTEMSEFKFFGS
jgi:hypothetical protein